jgi:hypothetical protein
MKYIIEIFFRSNDRIDLREITDAVKEGEFLFEEPRFDPDPEDEKIDTSAWTSLRLDWEEGKDSIVFRYDHGDEGLRKEIGDLTHILKISRKSKPAERVAEHISQTAQMLVIEMNREQISEEAWTMLDAIEARLAKKYDGIVYTQEGAFFDASLKRFYKL